MWLRMMSMRSSKIKKFCALAAGGFFTAAFAASILGY